jgi:cation transport protein ChaC
MALTADLVARVERIEPDPGPTPGQEYLTEPEYDALAHELIAESGDRPFWVFAYGSLIWKPECAMTEHRRATAHGWHRSFCLKLTRWRGTPDCPGLMMALDRGGACQGVVQRVAGKHAQERLDRLLRREMSVKPSTNRPRWVTAECGGVRVPAIAIAAHRDGFAYAGRHSLEETAAILARACGHWGSCAEYLMNTVAHLEALGIHDRYLWQLQERVAEEIRAARERPFAPATAPARRLG